jgi:hypothetical protein
MKDMLTGLAFIVVALISLAVIFGALWVLGWLISLITGITVSIATLICAGAMAFLAFCYIVGSVIND